MVLFIIFYCHDGIVFVTRISILINVTNSSSIDFIQLFSARSLIICKPNLCIEHNSVYIIRI